VHEDEQLDDLVDHVARAALRAFESDVEPSGSHDDHVAAVRSAIWESADAGGFRAWGVTRRDELAHLRFVVGYSLHVERFTLNPSDISHQILRAGWRARRRAARGTGSP
jgi:hypothetical protein